MFTIIQSILNSSKTVPSRYNRGRILYIKYWTWENSGHCFKKPEGNALDFHSIQPTLTYKVKLHNIIECDSLKHTARQDTYKLYYQLCSECNYYLMFTYESNTMHKLQTRLKVWYSSTRTCSGVHTPNLKRAAMLQITCVILLKYSIQQLNSRFRVCNI